MLILALSGCGDLSASEIRDAVDANLTVLADVETRIDTIETKVSTARHGQGDGDYVYQGVLDPAGTWDGGTITVDGTGSSTFGGSILFSSLNLVLAGVDVDGVVLDGTLDVTIAVTITDGSVAITYDVHGDETISGSASGTADNAWSMSASGAEGGVPHYSGTVNGKDLAKIED
jgi:hypothetical protein